MITEVKKTWAQISPILKKINPPNATQSFPQGDAILRWL